MYGGLVSEFVTVCVGNMNFRTLTERPGAVQIQAFICYCAQSLKAQFVEIQLTNYMDHHPWEANTSWASQEIPTCYVSEGPSPTSQQPATFPYNKPDEGSPCLSFSLFNP